MMSGVQLKSYSSSTTNWRAAPPSARSFGEVKCMVLEAQLVDPRSCVVPASQGTVVKPIVSTLRRHPVRGRPAPDSSRRLPTHYPIRVHLSAEASAKVDLCSSACPE